MYDGIRKYHGIDTALIHCQKCFGFVCFCMTAYVVFDGAEFRQRILCPPLMEEGLYNL